MKVFISWSGERSRLLAQALKEWLPLIIDTADPFVSDADIAGGERWALTVATELETSNFGLICVTPENLNSAWVLFEAGALSKSLIDGKVLPILFGLEFSDISGPLSQFQAKKADKTGMSEVVKSINKSCDTPSGDDLVKQRFDHMWAAFESKLGDIPSSAEKEKSARTQKEILEELVANVRGVENRVRSLSGELSDFDQSGPRMRRRRLHPGMIDEIVHELDAISDPVFLLVWAGFLRDDMPWFSEILVESYRELRTTPPNETTAVLRRLHSALRVLTDSRWLREMSGSKDAYILSRELPMLLHDSLDRYMVTRSTDLRDEDDG